MVRSGNHYRAERWAVRSEGAARPAAGCDSGAQDDDRGFAEPDRGMGAGHPGRPDLRPRVAVARPDRRHRPRHPARAAGDGLRGAGRSAADHGPLHDGRLPHRLRSDGAVAGPRPRPGFGLGPADRGDHPAPRRRRRAEGDRPGRDARAARRCGDGRCRDRQARVRRRPPLEPGPDRLPGRPRGRDPGRPAAQALRIQGGRGRPRERTRRVPPEPGQDEPVGAGDRAAEPGHHPRVAAGRPPDAWHPRGRRRLDRPQHRSRSRVPWRVGHRRPAPGLPVAVDPDLGRYGHPRPVRRPQSGSRWSRSATRSRRPAVSPREAATRSTATRSSRGSGPRTSPPGSSPASR